MPIRHRDAAGDDLVAGVEHHALAGGDAALRPGEDDLVVLDALDRAGRAVGAALRVEGTGNGPGGPREVGEADPVDQGSASSPTVTTAAGTSTSTT
jgi:hypothetical protein